MTRRIKIILLWLVTASVMAQPVKAQTTYNAELLDTLQHIAATETPAKYFAQMYYRVIEKTNTYAALQPDSVRHFVFGFEATFAHLFIQSYYNDVRHLQQDTPWMRYYDSTPKNKLQYLFIGMNAHINGDMCLALISTFNHDTIQKYSVPLMHFQIVLNQYFDSVYTTGKTYKKIRWLNLLTLGTDQWAGRYMIMHCRKRQERMALSYYSHPLRYRRKYNRLMKKMQQYDAFAMHWIK